MNLQESDMCIESEPRLFASPTTRTVPVEEAVGLVLAHDVTEIRKDEFKGRAFKKGTRGPACRYPPFKTDR